MGIECQFDKMKRVMKIDDSDDHTILGMYLIPLHCTPKKWLRWQILCYMCFTTIK